MHIYLQPKASKDEIVGVHDNCLKIRLTTPPIEGRANKHLLNLLQIALKFPPSKS